MEIAAGGVAVVTGAGSGIGLALCRAFAAEGCSIVLADVQEDALESASAEVGDDADTDEAGSAEDGEERDDVVVDLFARLRAGASPPHSASLGAISTVPSPLQSGSSTLALGVSASFWPSALVLLALVAPENIASSAL